MKLRKPKKGQEYLEEKRKVKKMEREPNNEQDQSKKKKKEMFRNNYPRHQGNG